jgi:hypothetical protein
MPAAGTSRLRDRKKEFPHSTPSFGHTSRRKSHLSFVELNARNEDQVAPTADKSLALGQIPCILEPDFDRPSEGRSLCDPCEVLATAIRASCGTGPIDPSTFKLGEIWTKSPGSDTLILTNHHGDYQALVYSGRTCQLCHLLSASWYRARGRQVRGSLKYQIRRGQLDHAFSLWTQKINVCSNGCCTELETEFQRLRTFEPFRKREDLEIAGSSDESAFLTKTDRDSVFGREVSSRSDSDLCTKLISQWLRTCRSKHPDCSRPQLTYLPTRVIDVRPPSGGADCRLFVTKDYEISPYIALSHCWGGRSLFCTTNSNFQTYQKCLRFEDFPKTFRDAVILTRALGFRYLWIDALCIIQGDARDWENEADAVGGYYRNAVLTISAMRAPDYNGGLFHPRKSVVAELPAGTSSGASSKSLFVREAYFPFPSATARITGPVSERAWVLQERLLSPAVLHFTKREIVWECRTQTCFEHGSYTMPQDYETKLLLTTGERNRTNRSTPGWRMPRKDRFREWYKLVQTYSAKKLTRNDDRLPAIAGLATRFHSMCHSTYLAGLWEEDVMRGLLWNTTDQEPPTDGVVEDLSAWHTPSWSWAATRRPVHYNTQLGDRLDKTSAKYSSTAVIHRADVDKPNPKSFGHVLGGCLEITGILRPARLLKIRLHSAQARFERAQMRWDRRPNCQHDKLWSIELGSWDQSTDLTLATIVYFLLLEPLDLTGQDTVGYERVGFAWCEWAGDGRPVIQPAGQSMKICIV